MLQMKMDNEPDYVTASKWRCQEARMDPDVPRKPKHIMSTVEFVQKKEKYSEVLETVRYYSNKILQYYEGNPVLFVVSDEKGFLLETIGDGKFASTLELFGIRPGIQFSEADMGTNAISLTLHQNHPIQLIGANHYHTFLHQTACYGAPFHYTDDNDLLGAICIMTSVVLHSSFFMFALNTVVGAIERELLLRKQVRGSQEKKVKEKIIGDMPFPNKESVFKPHDTLATLTYLLQKIGISAHLKGFIYLREAIMLVLKRKSYLNSMTKEIYPTVAMLYDTTESKVERAIRHAITVAWERGNAQYRDGIFLASIHKSKGKPTNQEFIAVIANKLRVELDVDAS